MDDRLDDYTDETFFFGTLSLSSHPFIFFLSLLNNFEPPNGKILFMLLSDESCHSPEL